MSNVNNPDYMLHCFFFSSLFYYQKGADKMFDYKKLDDLDVIPNVDRFECVVCFLEIEPGDGVVLRECLHTFCRECLKGAIEHSDSPKVGCPYKDDKYSCEMTILEREIKAVSVYKMSAKDHQAKLLL